LEIDVYHPQLEALKGRLQPQVKSVDMVLHIASNYPLLILSKFEEHVLTKMLNDRDVDEDARIRSCIEAGLGPLTKHPFVKSLFGDDLPVEVSLSVCMLSSSIFVVL
jgi:hypothetical protein